MNKAHVDLETGKIYGCKEGSFHWWHEKGHIEFNKNPKKSYLVLLKGYSMILWMIFVSLAFVYGWFPFALQVICLGFFLFVELYEEWWCNEYAKKNCDGYCAGCQEICSAAVPDVPCVGDVMRYMMYHDTYGNQQHARELYAKIPAEIRARLGDADYSLAEARCPQHITIAKIMADAAVKLA